MALNVASKTAIVTGAGSGINFAFASLLLSKGANVIIGDLALRPEAEKLVSEYSGSSKGAKAIFQKTDVSDWAQLEKLFEIAKKEFGGVDIVVPGAGVYEPPFSNFWSLPGSPPSTDAIASSHYKTLDINITHPIRTTQLAISHFLAAAKPGVVVLVSSVAGQIPVFATPMYVASKHAISGFARSLAALESPPSANIPKIRVNAVAPGIVKTPIWTEHPEKLKFVGGEDYPGWVTPEKVAEVMLELIEKEEYVGGTVLEVAKFVRPVEIWGDAGPLGSGNMALGETEAERTAWVEDVWESVEKRVGGGK